MLDHFGNTPPVSALSKCQHFELLSITPEHLVIVLYYITRLVKLHGIVCHDRWNFGKVVEVECSSPSPLPP
jgi:hypothetical protein